MEHFPTDNADVSLTKVSGWLVAMTETTLIHLIDPKTLETSHSLDIFNAPNLPEDLQIMTVTAHGHVDNDGTYWNMGTAMDMHGKMIPEVAYFVWKIPVADSDVKVSPEEFLASIEFSPSFAHNTDLWDLDARWFHMFRKVYHFHRVFLDSLKYSRNQTPTSTVNITQIFYNEFPKNVVFIVLNRELEAVI